METLTGKIGMHALQPTDAALVLIPQTVAALEIDFLPPNLQRQTRSHCPRSQTTGVLTSAHLFAK